MMKHLLLCLSLILVSSTLQGRDFDTKAYLKKKYTKSEVAIPMRDGTLLHTSIYAPKKKGSYPILMTRTCYSCRPYGDEMPGYLLGGDKLLQSGYIFICQDVRGRWMSEGDFDNMRPQLTGDQSEEAFDESTDTYDTIDWLINNVPNNNGKVGMLGISYPGFYTAVGTICDHPALVASSPQAPIADFYFDDFHHMGAYTLSYFIATSVFTYQHDGPTPNSWYQVPFPTTPDWYQYYMDLGPLKNGDKVFGEDAFFWQELKEHPNYDEFWQARNLLPHLRDIDHAVLTVGGWFDAEDLYGPLHIYQTIESENPESDNRIVMGPWSHGDWARRTGRQTIGHTDFGDNKDISEYFREVIQFNFFEYHLKGNGAVSNPEALMYDTGKRAWGEFDQWPPTAAKTRSLYLHADGELAFDEPPQTSQSWTEYLSDPANPVPHDDDVSMRFTPRPYMAGDQRDMGRRPDVITFQTDILEDDVTLAGEILARIYASTRPLHDGAAEEMDADYVVKIIDVYPDTYEEWEDAADHVVEGGYQQMVRGEIIRGRFRESFSNPISMTPNEINQIDLPLQDVHHTFRKGHRIMIQIQSTWFPLFDRNPQSWVENIFEADEEHFIPAWQRIYHDQAQPTRIEVQVLD